MNNRKIFYRNHSRSTVEGAGVNLKRAFGFYNTEKTDPFLLLDDFRSDSPDDYIAGFPWHPHRGIETITYMLEGKVEHGDSLGNSGVIDSGCVQWMTAGSGIIHQEMPKGDRKGRMGGFQLWANLPAKYKMTSPKYRDVRKADIPEVKLDNGVIIRIICGKINGIKGPVGDVVIEPEYLDVLMPAGQSFKHDIPDGHTVIAYIVNGEGHFGDGKTLKRGSLAIFSKEGEMAAFADKTSFRFLLVSGKPLNEPIAWGGPIVMNTREELRTAFKEYNNGTFIKKQ